MIPQGKIHQERKQNFTMTHSKDTAISVQKIINAQKEKITCIVGDITQEGIDNLE